MEFAWCRACGTDVSIAHAVAQFPCPSCGSTDYIVIADDGKRDELLSLSERMMRLGRWAEASSALSECIAAGLISPADYNLSAANIEWRRQCAASASDMIAAAGGRLPTSQLRLRLASDYDAFAVHWLLHEFRGLRLVSSGGVSFVEVS